MSKNGLAGLQYLDQCITDLDSLRSFRKLLEKFDKICTATQQRANLADIFQEPANRQSLSDAIGAPEFDAGMQLLLKLALPHYLARSFTINSPIEGQKKLEFLARSVQGWKQFDTVLVFQSPDAEPSASFTVINPQKSYHWKSVEGIAAGTLISVFVRDTRPERSTSQEKLAAERYEAIFDMLASQEEVQAVPAPVLQINTAAAPGKTAAKPVKPATKPASRPAPSRFARKPVTAGPLSFSFNVKISKMDVFVHAGNAHLIVTHIRNYPGMIQFYVLRDKKVRVQLDADSIWGAEIRNGETVLFEFYGPTPNEEFVKELAKKVNKYTQMDKIANE